jgi:hypothetical protein
VERPQQRPHSAPAAQEDPGRVAELGDLVARQAFGAAPAGHRRCRPDHAASRSTSRSCSTVGASRSPSGVRNTRHVRPTGEDPSANGSRPSTRTVRDREPEPLGVLGRRHLDQHDLAVDLSQRQSLPEASVGLPPFGAAGQPQQLDLHAADATPLPGCPSQPPGHDDGRPLTPCLPAGCAASCCSPQHPLEPPAPERPAFTPGSHHWVGRGLGSAI